MLDVDGADGERHPKSAFLGRVPNLGADGIRGIGEVLLAIHPEDDFILHARFAKIAQVDLGGRCGENSGGTLSSMEQRVFYGDRSGIQLKHHVDGGGAFSGRGGEVGDGAASDGLVRNIHQDVVSGAHARGAPVNLQHLQSLALK